MKKEREPISKKNQTGLRLEHGEDGRAKRDAGWLTEMIQYRAI